METKTAKTSCNSTRECLYTAHVVLGITYTRTKVAALSRRTQDVDAWVSVDSKRAIPDRQLS